MSFDEQTDEEEEEDQQTGKQEEECSHQENNGQEKVDKPAPTRRRLTVNTRRQQEEQQKGEGKKNPLMDCSYVRQKRQKEEQKGGKKNPLLDNPYFYMAEAIQELNKTGGGAVSEPMARDQEESVSVDSLDHELNRLHETVERLSLEKQQKRLTRRARNLRRNLEADESEYGQRRARSASPLGRYRNSSPHEEYRRVSGTLRLVKIPPEDPMWGKGKERKLILSEDSMPNLTPY